MSCEVIQKKLSFYLEGLYQNSELAEIEAHLASCAACRITLEQERAFLLLLRSSLRTSPAPAHVRSHIGGMLQKNRQKQFVRRSWLWICPLVLTSLVLVVALFIYSRNTHLDWVIGAHLAVNEDRHLLDITTDKPPVLEQWVATQTGLRFPLVAPQFAHIQLQGGKVLDAQKHIVQIAFSSDQGAASLYMMPKQSLSLSGPSVNLRHLTFYPKKKNEHVMVAWSDVKADYVLVSRTEAGLNRGCLLCHSSESIQLPLSAFLINS